MAQNFERKLKKNNLTRINKYTFVISLLMLICAILSLIIPLICNTIVLIGSNVQETSQNNISIICLVISIIAMGITVLLSIPWFVLVIKSIIKIRQKSSAKINQKTTVTGSIMSLIFVALGWICILVLLVLTIILINDLSNASSAVVVFEFIFFLVLFVILGILAGSLNIIGSSIQLSISKKNYTLSV